MSAGPDVSRLGPVDAIAALRSFGRRFTAVLALVDEETDAAIHRHGPDGRSALDHADLAGRDLAVLADAVVAVLTHDRPTLHPAVADPSARHYPAGLASDVGSALDLLVLEAEALADRASRVSAPEWGRSGTVAGGGETSALDLLREAVRTTAVHLRAAEEARQG